MDRQMKVLIGYDGSNTAERVIEDLKWAGLPDTVQAIVFSAADAFMPPAPAASTPPVLKTAIENSRDKAQEMLRFAQSLSEHGAQQVKKAFPKWDVSPASCADTPAWALIKKAEEWKADLIAVGAHGHSPIGRFLGSVSQMVALHASQSVRIARPRHNPHTKRLRVLVGIDASAGAQATIDMVTKRSWGPHTEVFLMSVVEPKMSALMRMVTPSEVRWVLEHADDERTTLGRILESYARGLRDKGVSVTYRVETGDPKQLLVNYAETWEADSIFIGARGLGNVKRFMIGGVSAAVSTRAKCSVEIIRHD